MGYFTRRNTAILALIQIGIVVAGVLAAGAACKWWQQSTHPPSSLEFVARYGWLALLVPMTWITVTLILQSRAEDEGVAILIAYLSGIIVIVLLLVTIYYLVLRPGFPGFLDA